MPRESKNFDAIDTDKDGTVSMDEIEAAMMHAKQAMQEKGEAAFKKADADNDGTLDKGEAKAMPRVGKNFDAIDTDEDGTVSMDEIRAFMKASTRACSSSALKHVDAGVLSIAYKDSSCADGKPVVLLHNFPYDIHGYDEVTRLLVSAGCRVITPCLRGYEPTRFFSPATPRSGQQAVLAQDLLALMDGQAIERAVLAGYD